MFMCHRANINKAKQQQQQQKDFLKSQGICTAGTAIVIAVNWNCCALSFCPFSRPQTVNLSAVQCNATEVCKYSLEQQCPLLQNNREFLHFSSPSLCQLHQIQRADS